MEDLEHLQSVFEKVITQLWNNYISSMQKLKLRILFKVYWNKYSLDIYVEILDCIYIVSSNNILRDFN